MTLRDALLTAPFAWWIASSMLGFLLAIPFAILSGLRAVVRRWRAPVEIASPARRDFLAQTTRHSHRRAVPGRRLRPALRTPEPGDGGAAHPAGQPAALVSRLSHRAALRYPHRTVHARRADSQVRRHRQCVEAGPDRADRRLRHLRRRDAVSGGGRAGRFARALRRLWLPGQPRRLGGRGGFDHAACSPPPGVRILRGESVAIAVGARSVQPDRCRLPEPPPLWSFRAR